MVGVARADNGCQKYETTSSQKDHYDDDAISALSGCNKNIKDQKTNGIFWIDRPTHKVSEIARVFHVFSCYDVGPDKATDMYLPDRYFMCGMDAKVLNKVAYEAEVDATALDAQHKATMKAVWAPLQSYVERANRVTEDRAKDPVYKKVLDAQAAGLKDWDRFYGENKALIDATAAVEDKWWASEDRTSKPLDLGCDPVRAGWQKWLADKKITSAKQVPDAVKSDELGTIVLRALALCDAAARVQPAAAMEGEALERNFPFRGSRMHAVWVAMTALGKLIPDNVEPVMQPIKGPDYLAEQVNKALDSTGFEVERKDHLEQGKIDKVVASGKDVNVTFKKESWMEPDMECYDLPTRYWSQSDGRYKHDFACKKVGQHKETSQLDPAVFPAAYAKGLKPGQVATVRIARPFAQHDKRYGFAIESRSGTGVADKGKEKFKKSGNDVLQTGGSLDVLYGVPMK
ncbi:MAG: hypothetical protein ACXVDD_02370 [Polyangia bacterium]